MHAPFKSFVIRDWQPADRQAAAELIGQVLTDYGLGWEPEGADIDVVQVETHYQEGEFWVVEQAGTIVGTAAYHPIERGKQAVEIRKMYLLPVARGQGLGRFLLGQLERAIAARGFQEIWLETATVLKEAVRMYESSGYLPATGVETSRCDRVYKKRIAA
ncbi:GNAT family N-acetyltransferase [Leptolyngbya cf. ectocarpi LEGE 11479]|uniref:GNAT family N-acetyltransferase n=1 Tax=Leptolyngbya cf. ectocarpi LEGE 11479 TaxID=1828722 RepID=A0A929FCK8_LEPEC|nr:GNAT family N-acetyltransferase [Leptolyngbya ectocarpi]MBE9070104.1 GNAT family N-acetyltransferase [Leptolyngbya cf. ectocarpi LEGE 11479]